MSVVVTSAAGNSTGVWIPVASLPTWPATGTLCWGMHIRFDDAGAWDTTSRALYDFGTVSSGTDKCIYGDMRKSGSEYRIELSYDNLVERFRLNTSEPPVVGRWHTLIIVQNYDGTRSRVVWDGDGLSRTWNDGDVPDEIPAYAASTAKLLRRGDASDANLEDVSIANFFFALGVDGSSDTDAQALHEIIKPTLSRRHLQRNILASDKIVRWWPLDSDGTSGLGADIGDTVTLNSTGISFDAEDHPDIPGDKRMANEASVGLSKLGEWRDAISTERVGFLAIGDSNQLRSSPDEGHMARLMAKFEDIFTSDTVCSTGFIGSGANSGSGLAPMADDVGRTSYHTSLSSGTAFSGSPSDAELPNAGGGRPFSTYAYIADGSAISSKSNFRGLINVQGSGTITSTSAMRVHTWAAGHSGTPQYKPEVRLGQSPWTSITAVSTVTLGTDDAIERNSIDIVADAGRAGAPIDILDFCSGDTSTPFSGELTHFGSNVELTANTTGICPGNLIYDGGDGAFAFNTNLTNLTDAGLANLINWNMYPVDAAGDTGYCVVAIMTGTNDRNKTNTSVDGVNQSNTIVGHKADIEALIQTVRDGWTAAGRDLSLLRILLLPTHKMDTVDEVTAADETLEGMRQAQREVAEADPRVAYINPAAVTPTELLEEQSFMNGTTDYAHQDVEGYDWYWYVVWTILKEMPAGQTEERFTGGVDPMSASTGDKNFYCWGQPSGVPESNAIVPTYLLGTNYGDESTGSLQTPAQAAAACLTAVKDKGYGSKFNRFCIIINQPQNSDRFDWLNRNPYASSTVQDINLPIDTRQTEEWFDEFFSLLPHDAVGMCVLDLEFYSIYTITTGWTDRWTWFDGAYSDVTSWITSMVGTDLTVGGNQTSANYDLADWYNDQRAKDAAYNSIIRPLLRNHPNALFCDYNDNGTDGVDTNFQTSGRTTDKGRAQLDVTRDVGSLYTYAYIDTADTEAQIQIHLDAQQEEIALAAADGPQIPWMGPIGFYDYLGKGPGSNADAMTEEQWTDHFTTIHDTLCGETASKLGGKNHLIMWNVDTKTFEYLEGFLGGFTGPTRFVKIANVP